MDSLELQPYYHKKFAYSCHSFVYRSDQSVQHVMYRSMSGKVLLTKQDNFEQTRHVHLWFLYPCHALVRVHTWTMDSTWGDSEHVHEICFMSEVVKESAENYQVEMECKAYVFHGCSGKHTFLKNTLQFCLLTGTLLHQNSSYFYWELENYPHDIQKSIESIKAHNALLQAGLHNFRHLQHPGHFFSLVLHEEEQNECFLSLLKILTHTQCVFDWSLNTKVYQAMACTPHFAFLYLGSWWKEKCTAFVLHAKSVMIRTGFWTSAHQEPVQYHSIFCKYGEWLYANGDDYFVYHTQKKDAEQSWHMVTEGVWMAPCRDPCLRFFCQNKHLLVLSPDSSLFFYTDNIGKYQMVKIFLKKQGEIAQQNERATAVFKHALQYCEKLESLVPLLYNIQHHRQEVFDLMVVLFGNLTVAHDDSQNSIFMTCNTIQALWSQQEILLQSKLPAHVFFAVQDFVTKGDHSSLTKLCSTTDVSTE